MLPVVALSIGSQPCEFKDTAASLPGPGRLTITPLPQNVW